MEMGGVLRGLAPGDEGEQAQQKSCKQAVSHCSGFKGWQGDNVSVGYYKDKWFAAYSKRWLNIVPMNGQYRKDIYPGLEVAIILKKDQRSGKLTYGIVKDILTSAAYHSRGIKVRLEDGQIGRVAETDVVDPEEE